MEKLNEKIAMKLHSKFTFLYFVLVSCFAHKVCGATTIQDSVTGRPPATVLKTDTQLSEQQQNNEFGFSPAIQSIYEIYKQCKHLLKKDDLQEMWCIFFSFLQQKNKPTQETINTIFKISRETTEKMKAFKSLLQYWYKDIDTPTSEYILAGNKFITTKQ